MIRADCSSQHPDGSLGNVAGSAIPAVEEGRRTWQTAEVLTGGIGRADQHSISDTNQQVTSDIYLGLAMQNSNTKTRQRGMRNSLLTTPSNLEVVTLNIAQRGAI